MIKRFITRGPDEVCKNGVEMVNNVTFRGLQFFLFRPICPNILGKYINRSTLHFLYWNVSQPMLANENLTIFILGSEL